jgi:hypothetical protein
MARSSGGRLPGGWLVVHFTNRKNAPFLFPHEQGRHRL